MSTRIVGKERFSVKNPDHKMMWFIQRIIDYLEQFRGAACAESLVIDELRIDIDGESPISFSNKDNSEEGRLNQELWEDGSYVESAIKKLIMSDSFDVFISYDVTHYIDQETKYGSEKWKNVFNVYDSQDLRDNVVYRSLESYDSGNTITTALYTENGLTLSPSAVGEEDVQDIRMWLCDGFEMTIESDAPFTEETRNQLNGAIDVLACSFMTEDAYSCGDSIFHISTSVLLPSTHIKSFCSAINTLLAVAIANGSEVKSVLFADFVSKESDIDKSFAAIKLEDNDVSVQPKFVRY